MENAHMTRADYLYPISCSGTCIYRHNLAATTGLGTKYQLKVEAIEGEVALMSQDANIFTVLVGPTTTSGHFRLVAMVDIDDNA